MSTAADKIIRQLSVFYGFNSVGDDFAKNVHALDVIDPNFSRLADKLLSSGDSAIGEILLFWLDHSHRLEVARGEADSIAKKVDYPYTVATYVLYDAVRKSSVERLKQLRRQWNEWTTGSYTMADYQFLISSGVLPLPNLETASDDDFDRYYHPMVVAASLYTPKDDDYALDFVANTEAFIQWAAAFPDMHEALNSAYLTGSIDPDTITAYMKIREDVTFPLRNGAL